MHQTRILAGTALALLCASAVAADMHARPLPQPAAGSTLSWTQVSPGSGGSSLDLWDMTYGGGRFVAVGSDFTQHLTGVMVSADGLHWNTVTLNTATAGSRNVTVTYGSGTYLVADDADWYTSTDATHWTAVTSHPSSFLNRVVYGDGKFLAFSDCSKASSCAIATSTDGKTWKMTHVSSGFFKDQAAFAFTFDGTRFVSIGRGAAMDTGATEPEEEEGSPPVYTSCDGITWTHSSDIANAPTAGFGSLQAPADELIALGSDLCIGDPSLCDDTPMTTVVGKSPDGSQWDTTRLSDEFDDAPFGKMIHAGGQYYSAFDEGDFTEFSTSTDAVGWSAVPGLPTTASTGVVAAGGGRIVVAGEKGEIFSAPISDISVPKGSACHDLPAVSSNGGLGVAGSGGDLSLLTLTALLGLLALRRRET